MNPEMDMTQPIGTPNAGSAYVVQKGDSLWRIAEKVLGDGRRWKELAQVNGIRNPDMIRPGQVIRMPGSSVPNPPMRPGAPPPVPAPVAAMGGANMATVPPPGTGAESIPGDVVAAMANPQTSSVGDPGWTPRVGGRPNPTDPRAIMMRQMMGG